MSFSAFIGAVEQGFIYSFMVLGLYISFRTLNIADLTSDGSFTLGAAVSAVMTLAGHPILGIILGGFAGALAGLLTAFLQTKLKIAPILSGIIVMTALYSINLNVMGNRANISLLRAETIFTKSKNVLFLLFLIAMGGAALLFLFFKTRTGLTVRATGDNACMVRSSSINPSFTITLGLMLANGCVGLGGGLLAQYQQFCEITMGTGVVVLGLASLIIGEVLLLTNRRTSVLKGISASVLGAILYRIIMAAALGLNISPQNLKLFSAVIVVLAISYPTIREHFVFLKTKREALQCSD
ncbi:MAG: ABC transporter permease [Oscillospiraceae bacterium]